MRSLVRGVVKGVLALALVAGTLFGTAWLLARNEVGDTPNGGRLARAQQSAQWRAGRFRNTLPRVDGPFGVTMRRWFFGGSSEFSTPASPPAIQRRTRADFAFAPPTGLRVTWLGHSTTLVEIDGYRVLTDPMFSERASPFAFAGPERHFAPPLALAELPRIDAVVISHDHYDHLDRASVVALAADSTQFVVPLGVGARLESWGIPLEQITELDWWESRELGALTITATPARHFSGRWVNDADETLWAGWSIATGSHAVYYSGDTALLNEMEAIGERLGPFDVALIEIGEYDALWADVHLGPEQAVRASRLVRAAVMLPVHWATFDLAFHGWTEPMERALVAAQRERVQLAAPRPGESIDVGQALPAERWWPELPWRRAEEAPAYSSNVRDLWDRTAPELR